MRGALGGALLTQFVVLGSLTGMEDMHIDKRIVSPILQISDDRRTLTLSGKKPKAYADGLVCFGYWSSTLATTYFQAKMHAWIVNIQNSFAY